MTEREYFSLSSDLQQLAKIIPLQWGAIQNNTTDGQIDMFVINSFDALERAIINLQDASKNYFRRRWFLWKCAQCDEYIFCTNENVMANPNSKDQDYDLEFNGNIDLRFDIKGTVIPKKFRDKIEAVLQDPTEMIAFFYEQQSVGVRSHIQNRLFIIHHSHRHQEREMYLRCHWELKAKIYKAYTEHISTSVKLSTYKSIKADIIFIFEHIDKTFSHRFMSQS